MISTSFWYKKSVFVTGATGLLGPWLIEELVSKNANVIALVRDHVHQSLFFTTELYKKVTFIFGDLSNFSLLLRVINEYNISTVFHLGAQAVVGYANRSPISTFESNIQGTWNILEACRLSPWINEVIVASSDKAYGEHAELPYTEDFALQGKYPYDVSKSCADLITQSYYHTYKLPVCITRCGNFFGGGDMHSNRIIPGTIHAVLENKQPVIRSNGLFVRDYIYVKDVVDAYLTLAEQMVIKNLIGHAFNFSTDKPYTVIDIVHNIIDIMERNDLQPIIQNKASHEIPAQHLDSSKARALLGWQARYGVCKGIKETVDWYTHYHRTENNVQKKQKDLYSCSML